MQAVLHPVNVESGSSAYSSKIPSYFLERKLISDGMAEGGVLKVLQDHGDWVKHKNLACEVVDMSIGIYSMGTQKYGGRV
jgi:hypothetical protein